MRPILAADCDPSSRKLIHALGFPLSTPLAEVVYWHRQMLEQSTRRY